MNDQSLSWRSEPETQTAQELFKRTISVISRTERLATSLHFNHSLCERFVSHYLRRARELLEDRKVEIETYGEECAPTLAALFTTVKEAEFLIQKHCTRANWIEAAVELVENTSAFAEVILDLKWYIHALRISIEYASGTTPRQSQQRQQRVWDLQRSAMAEYANFLENWEHECQQLCLHKDREVLLLKLKSGSRDHISEIRSLDLYLARKLSHQDKSTHVREALNVDVSASELLQNKVLLGEGAYGKVYQVQWLGMQCAVKQIGGKTAIDEEVKILSKLHHPNIIQLYGYSLDQGTLYLIMELMDKTLGEYIYQNQQGAPFSLHVALDSMLQIAKGMRYLHSKGMAHRDLKGGNVLVKPSGNPELQRKGYLSVKLTDFGMAKANLRYSTVTPQSMNVGTLVWKAPELFRLFHSEYSNSGGQKLRTRNYYPFKADVYSFGMVCYEILCGKRPFSDVPFVSTSSFYAKVKRGDRPELPEFKLLPGLSDYIKRCWDTDPCRRPDFVEICKRIRHFRDSLLQVTAYQGWELKPHEGTRPVIQEPSVIDENDFIDADDWNWEIDYKDVVRGDKPIPGGSGFHAVYPAWWKNSEQVLAKYIEVMLIDTDDRIANFKREVALLVRMQHPNLVHYLGASSKPFVVFTELAKGMIFLRKFLERNPTVSQVDAVHIAEQVALGMASLHEEEVTVIHGELSPDCILINPQTLTARVADFGLRDFRNPPLKWQPRWFRAAPEQHNAPTLHTSMDVFSFGMILYELLEPVRAHLFWKNKRAAEILRKGSRPPLNTAKCYPSGMKTLMERCWSPEPERRPNFGTIVSELQKLSNKLSRSKASHLSRSTSSSSSSNHSRNGRR